MIHGKISAKQEHSKPHTNSCRCNYSTYYKKLTEYFLFSIYTIPLRMKSNTKSEINANLKISQGVYPDEYKLKTEFRWKVSFAKTDLKESNLN